MIKVIVSFRVGCTVVLGIHRFHCEERSYWHLHEANYTNGIIPLAGGWNLELFVPREQQRDSQSTAEHYGHMPSISRTAVLRIVYHVSLYLQWSLLYRFTSPCGILQRGTYYEASSIDADDHRTKKPPVSLYVPEGIPCRCTSKSPIQ